MRLEVKLIENFFFLEDLGWIQVLFEKILISYSCISFMKYYALRSFYINLLCFSKVHFSKFLIDRTCFLTDRNCNKNFQFLSIWPNFFLHHLCLGFTCIALIFLYPSCNFAVISHITCIHFAKLGTQLDLKIDWLIFEIGIF